MRIMQNVLIFWFFMRLHAFIWLVYMRFVLLYTSFAFRAKQKKKVVRKKFPLVSLSPLTTTKRRTTVRTVEFQLSWNGSYVCHLFDVTNTNGFTALMKNCCFLATNTGKIHASTILCVRCFSPLTACHFFSRSIHESPPWFGTTQKNST